MSHDFSFSPDFHPDALARLFTSDLHPLWELEPIDVQPASIQQKWLKAEQVATHFGIAPTSVYEKWRKGEWPCARFAEGKGVAVRMHVEDVADIDELLRREALERLSEKAREQIQGIKRPFGE